MLKNRLPPMHPMNKRDLHGGRKRDYTPVHWNQYFNNRDFVTTERGKFCIYLSEPSEVNDSPLIVMLHGGGYSALTWAHFSTSITELIHCQTLAIDLRGHGETETADDKDLSADSLSVDVADVILQHMKDKNVNSNVFLVGHSMGGAIAVHIASQRLLDTCLIGLSVIDVVEGTALDALASMQSFLRSRPSHFKSVEHAIEWSVRSGQIRNLDSAKVSMQGQIINVKTGQLASSELWNNPETTKSSTQDDVIESLGEKINPDCILEEEHEDNEELNNTNASNFKPPLPPELQILDTKKYSWRINLSQTEQHWPGWFKGLSNMFLEVPVPKLLLLASIDGLDRTLTVGQMQGKFQMRVLPRCGHAVQEDRPHEVAEIVSEFLVRHKFAKLKTDVQTTAVI
ncbi:protein phosphatase methylesterase 1-like [Ctenocephalides felis]|nr:protein phosphatase methylesterase 1-like [Ctenocephalides felis]